MKAVVTLVCVAFGTLVGATVGQAQQSMSKVIVPSIAFDQADLPSVLDFLGMKAREAKAKPSNIILYAPDLHAGKPEAMPTVTLQLSHVPLSQAVRYAAKVAGMQIHVDGKTVWVAKPQAMQELKQRQAAYRSPAVMRSAAYQGMRHRSLDALDLSGSSFVDAVDSLRALDRAKGGNGNFVLIGSDTYDPARMQLHFSGYGLNLAELSQYLAEISGFTIRTIGDVVIYRAPDAAPIPDIAPIPTLSRMKIATAAIDEATMPEMIEFIQYHSRSAPAAVNVVDLTGTQGAITLDLQQVSLDTVLRLSCAQTGTTYRSDGVAVQIVARPLGR